MRSFSLIYARTLNNGIGYKNMIPWKDSDDLKHFKKVTMNNIVLMGKKTQESIGGDLPNRINIIISKFNILEFTLKGLMKDEYKNKEIFVIGGGELYNYCIRHFSHLIRKLYITLITSYTGECDTFILPIHESEFLN